MHASLVGFSLLKWPRKTLNSVHGPVEITIRSELHFEKVRRVLSLLSVSEDQKSVRDHLAIDLAEERSPVMLRKIEQHISQHHQVEHRLLWHRFAQIRIP